MSSNPRRCIVRAITRSVKDVDRDLGLHSFDERDRQAVARRLVARPEVLGCKASLDPAARWRIFTARPEPITASWSASCIRKSRPRRVLPITGSSIGPGA
jgi:hypothetical protein